MKADRDSIFRAVDPPAGGTARMRARFARAQRRRLPPAGWLGPVVIVTVAALAFNGLWNASRSGSSDRVDSLLAAPEFDRLLGRESAPYELRVTRDSMPVSVNEIESSDPTVRLYRLDLDPLRPGERTGDPVL